ncbi:DUF3231 family protein [Bacillus suaedae]|uniref:DUF3231 family protein n=1 Tax=Halalkalibacter suaedae TaxID=2822140 RepID=A0A941AQ97_9BACI|nr:DUF3231 family protein [Bacillus suaedae]MBP3950923.1 DUF3231 family protein [Bacillus suaedae]
MMVENSQQLTSTELAMLWSGYIENTMAKCILKYSLSIVKDSEIQGVIELGLATSEKNIAKIKGIFEQEKIPVPYGFSDSDVNVDAPRLYSDAFLCRYLEFMGRNGEVTYSLAHGTSARKDIRDFFRSCLFSSAALFDKAAEVMLKKGIFVRSPYIAYPTNNEYVHKESFLTGFFGEKRTLTSIEIAHIATNVESNSVGTSMLMGFAQVAQMKEVKKYFSRGFEIGKKQIDILTKVLKDDNTSSPQTWDGTVTGSTVSPFSDKLMMYQTLTMNALSLGNYGSSLGGSPRRDIGLHYIRFIGEVGNYATDGAELMITNGWMEKPPHTVDRQEITKPS